MKKFQLLLYIPLFWFHTAFTETPKVNQIPNFLNEIEMLDPTDIWNALNDMSSCAEYEGGYHAFRIINTSIGFQGLVNKVENCLSIRLDRSIGAICLEEQRLDELERKHRNDDDEALDQIDGYRANLEDIKAEVEDQLYTIADLVYEFEKELEDVVEDSCDDWLGSGWDDLCTGFGRVAITSEVGGFRRFFEIKARNLCGYNPFEKADKDKSNLQSI